MDTIRERAAALLKQNRRVTDGHQYTVPSPETYPYQWLWDSCFHAIVLARLEPEAAMAELRSLVARQFGDGMIPHIIYWVPGELHRYDWGKGGETSALTQPPMLAYAAWRVYEATRDTRFLIELYPSLMRYYAYLVDKRDPSDHHLAGIINPDESGEDNSPRFDAVLHVPVDISRDDHLKRRVELIDANRACRFDAELCMKRHFWVKDVPFNAILVENLRILGEIAKLLGKPDGAHFCQLHVELVSEAMRERLFDGRVYWSAVAITDYERLEVATWAHFAPLFAGLYTSDEERRVVAEELLNEDTFWAPYGLRTVSKREPSYRSDGYWRGSAWMAPHWFVYQGLMRYGFVDEARLLRDRSVALIEQSGFREYFDPETGAGYGARDFTWGALAVDMMGE
jgi:glycogen debranching enzyme